MELNTKINEILNLSKISPVLAVGFNASLFDGFTLINSDIPSKKLAIINTAKGMKTPSWLFDILKQKTSPKILIDKIDQISEYEQEKFYELLKYKTISSVALPSDCNIIILANDISRVSKIIKSLCVIVK